MFKRDAESGIWREPRSMNLVSYGLLLSLLAVCAMAQAPKPDQPAQDFSGISGMYSFEHEGEFVQVTVEQRTAKADKPKPLAVTGYISRYADTDSDRGAFLDYFIAKGSLDGSTITFVTKPVHGVFYGFKGQVARGAATSRDKDGYYELRGILTKTTATGETSSAQTKEITMKLYPDVDSAPAKAK
jgi:hypothetical protein